MSYSAQLAAVVALVDRERLPPGFYAGMTNETRVSPVHESVLRTAVLNCEPHYRTRLVSGMRGLMGYARYRAIIYLLPNKYWFAELTEGGVVPYQVPEKLWSLHVPWEIVLAKHRGAQVLVEEGSLQGYDPGPSFDPRAGVVYRDLAPCLAEPFYVEPTLFAVPRGQEHFFLSKRPAWPEWNSFAMWAYAKTRVLSGLEQAYFVLKGKLP